MQPSIGINADMWLVTSLARVNSSLTEVQSTNDEPQTALQICFGKRADHSSTFGGGGIKNKQKKKRIGSRVTGVEEPKNGEKETTVAEQDERARSKKGMPVDAEKGCFIADLIVVDKAVEERWTGGTQQSFEKSD
ncbi:hypothetical protein Ancab_011481 [Ancistrocladus abbreviatus]